MSFKAIEGTNLYVVYFWDGYEGEWAVCCVCATERKAKEEYRRRNKDFSDNVDSEIISEEGDVIWSAVDNESSYYYYARANLVI